MPKNYFTRDGRVPQPKIREQYLTDRVPLKRGKFVHDNSEGTVYVIARADYMRLSENRAVRNSRENAIKPGYEIGFEKVWRRGT